MWPLAVGVAGCVGGDGGTGEPNGDGATDGDGGTGSPAPTLAGAPSLISPDFDDGAMVPTRFTCDGENVSPELDVRDVPGEAASLALVVDDPDAPGGTFTHWLLWDVPPSTGRLPEGVPRGESVDSLGGASQGTNDADVVGYSGPCPPRDDGAHTYRFRLLALAEPLDLAAAVGRGAFDEALTGVGRSEATLRGTYDR